MGIICTLNGNVLIGTYQGIKPSENQKLDAQRFMAIKQNALNAGYKEEEIEVKWVTDEEWLKIQEANKPIPTYSELRARAYPDYREYLDGIVKGDQEQIDKYINDCLAVKEKYPKE